VPHFCQLLAEVGIFDFEVHFAFSHVTPKSEKSALKSLPCGKCRKILRPPAALMQQSTDH